jgi:hypothetical protein
MMNDGLCGVNGGVFGGLNVEHPGAVLGGMHGNGV